MSITRHPLVIGVSIVLAVVFVVLWFDTFDVSQENFHLLFETFNWLFLIPIALLLIAHVALSSLRWTLIEFGICGERPAFRSAMTAGIFALGLGTLLPSPVVNMACRGLSNRANGASGFRGVISGGLDQLSDLFTVSLVAIPALVAFLLGSPFIYFTGASVALIAGVAIVCFIPQILQLRSLRVRFERLGHYPDLNRSLLLQVYFISIARLVLFSLINVAIHAATGTATVSAVLVSVPLVMLAIATFMLPGGIGISEWSFSAVFAGFGVSSSEIVIFVLANRLVLTGVSLVLLAFALLVVASRFSLKVEKKTKLRSRNVPGKNH